MQIPCTKQTRYWGLSWSTEFATRK
jgi:hypothetical protein